MGRLRMRALAIGCCAVLLVPGAAEAVPFSASVSLPAGASLVGNVALRDSAGIIDLAPAIQAEERTRVDWTSARGYLVTRFWNFTGPSKELEIGSMSNAPRNESLQFTAGSLGNMTCAAKCKALLFAKGDPETSVSIEGGAAGPLGWLRSGATYVSGWNESGHPDSFYFAAGPGWLGATGRGGTGEDSHLTDSRLFASGRIGLFLANVSGEIHQGDQVRPFSTVMTSRPIHGPAGVVIGRSISVSFLLLHLEGTRLDAPADSHAKLFAPRPHLTLNGTLDAPEAVGSFLWGERRVELTGGRLIVEGSLSGRWTASEGEAVGSPLLSGAFIPIASASGDATSVRAGAIALVASAERAPPAEAGLSVALLLLAIAAWLKSTASVPLYTRIDRGSVRGNKNRSAILDALTASPGMTVTEIMRATGLRDVVVRHHLRILASHSLVIRRASGSVKVYFAEGSTSLAAAPARMALQDATRRRVAAALASAALPRTQREVSEELGISLRLMSHHVGRLEKDGLVSSSGLMPKRYQATERLRAFLAPSEPRLASDR